MVSSVSTFQINSSILTSKSFALTFPFSATSASADSSSALSIRLGIGCYLLIENRDNPIDIAFTQTILVAVLNGPTAGIDHKNSLPVCSTFFINHKHTCSYPRSIKQVCRKADDSFDPVFLK